MNGISLNITSIMLFLAGSFIIYGSNFWVLTVKSLPVDDYITISSTNIAAMFAITIGHILSQIHIYNQYKKLNLHTLP